MKKISLLSLVLFGLLTTPVFAQLGVDPLSLGTLEQGPSVQLQPEFPQPNEKFTATLTDYSSGAFGAGITWLWNGEIVPGSTNAREVTLTAGPAGETGTLTLILNKSDGTRTEEKINIKPLYLDIIFEPQTHVPEFYLGRSLPSIDSIVNATAIVSSGKVVDQDLVYTWRVGREVVGGGPMRGRHSVSFETPIDTRVIVTVSVSHPDGTQIAERATIIPSVQPYVRFYESNTLLGLKEKPAKDPHTIIGNGVTLRAEPYHLDSNVFNSPSLLEWSIGNNSYPNSGSNPYEVTLETTGGGGRTSLNFHVRDTSQVLQGVRDSIDIKL